MYVPVQVKAPFSRYSYFSIPIIRLYSIFVDVLRISNLLFCFGGAFRSKVVLSNIHTPVEKQKHIRMFTLMWPVKRRKQPRRNGKSYTKSAQK